MLTNFFGARLLGLIVALVVVNWCDSTVWAGENLIKNPGFEAGPIGSPGYGWTLNNWAKNEVDFALDTQNPHSGKFCQRMTMKRIVHEADLQLSQFNFPARPGMALRFSFWVRGRANSLPMMVHFRKAGAPYTSYWNSQIPLSEQWQEYVFNLVLPANTDSKDTCLMFHLQDENTIWLDDVSVTELPGKDPSPALRGNLIANGSFEVGTDRWYGDFHTTGGYANDDLSAEKNVHARFVASQVSDAPEGRQVLDWEVLENCGVAVTSAYFPLRYGYPATVSFQFKSSLPKRSFTVRLGGGKAPNVVTVVSKTFQTPDTQWHTYTLEGTPEPTTTGTYFLEINTDVPGQYQLDAVCVCEGAQPLVNPQADEFTLGIAPANAQHPANIFYPEESAGFVVRVRDTHPKAAGQPLALTARVVDVWDHEVGQQALTLTLDKQGYGQGELTLPTKRKGGFKCELRRVGQNTPIPDAEAIYTVVPRLPSPGEAPDSFFGGHVLLTTYNLYIAEHAGFRWVRMHPPLDTKWRVVEPEKDKFVFHLDGVRRAHEMGFHILGVFDTTPDFYTGVPKGKSSFWTNFAPGDWPAYRRYVVRTAQAFAPYIQQWEVWNEPDSECFLIVPPDKKRHEVYLEIARQTRQAVEEGRLNIRLIGPTVSGLGQALFFNVLNQGAAIFDAVSFHHYPETRGVEEFTPPMQDILAHIRRLPYHRPGPPEIWMTEGGIWLAQSSTWLQTSRKPVPAGSTVLDAAQMIVRTAIAFKALGLTRHIHYADLAQPTGSLVYRDECSSMIDVNGIPGPALAAHAAMVSFLDQAQPVGLEVRESHDAKVVIARFRTNRQRIAIVWSRIPVKAVAVADLLTPSTQAYDMMSNPLPMSPDMGLSLSPIYFIQ